mmetsp:Transcript_46638/g.141482  ORF Transcript_46638/g.141482 Transcript_46638/m.141482 type:complete len:557 (+) Transcript_46638:74-1744(+)
MASAAESTSARPNTAPCSPKSVAVSDETVALQLQQFLDDWHYRVMQSSLAKIWSQTKTVSAALEIMALNGVPLTPEDIGRMAAMEEPAMVQELVRKLPVHVREDFDHLGLQLQMLITTTVRIRKAIDEGVPEGIQEVVEETDSTSIGQQILKRAVVQASKEVAALHRCQETWTKSTEKRLDRLTRSAEFAEHAQQQLIAVETQLERFGAQQNEKSKKALMGLAESNDKSLLHTTFSTWLGMVLAGAGERAIRKKFEEEINVAEKALFDYKEKQLANVKNVLMRNARESDEGLVTFVLSTWAEQVAEAKRDGTTKETLMALEARLQQFSSSQSENTKKVMARMGADKDANLVNIAWASWMKFSTDYKKDKEFEDQVKKAEQQFAEHMKKKKDDAKQVLDRMNGATETGLLASVIQNWYQCVIESQKAREMDDLMSSQGNKFKSLQMKQKGSAMSVQGRINEQIRCNLLLRCLSAWSLESRINHVDKYYVGKMNHKRQQLSSVQTLFKSFAKQLEDGLGNIDGESSGRTMTRRSKAGLTKDGGSVSLPDIHARQGVPA